MPTPLKRQIEEVLGQAIMQFAGAQGQQVDPDLEEGQILQRARPGILLLTSDYKRGPMVTLKVLGSTKLVDESATANGRTMLLSSKLRIEGLSGYSPNLAQTILDRDTLEEIIQLNLLKADLSLAGSDYDYGEKDSYALELNFIANGYDEEIVPGEQSAPLIEYPVPASANTSTGQIVVNTAHAYMAAIKNSYTIQIVSGSTTPGNLGGVTWKWRKGGSGPYSTPVAATGSYQELADGIQIKLQLATGQNFVTGDRWTIQASPDGHDYVALFWQEWQVLCEAFSGI